LEHKNDFKVKNLLLIYFLLFGLCFVNEDFKSAAYWLNEIDDAESEGFRQDLKNLGKLYMLVVDYEKNNFELLESHLRSFLRQIKVYKLEISKEMFVAIEFFKKIEKKAAIINRQNDFYSELETILKEMLKANKLGHMKYLYVWLESRLSEHKIQPVAKVLPPAFF